MSKRYGRNQKQQHRNLVAMLLAAVDQSGRELVQTRNTLKKTQQQLYEANDTLVTLREILRGILPKGHIALPPDQRGHLVEMQPGEPVLVCEEEFSDPVFDLEVPTVATVSLQAMQTLAIRIAHRMREDQVYSKQQAGLLHCYLRMGRTAEVCYGISNSAIEWLPKDSLARLLQQQITPLLGEKLAAELKR